MLGALYDNHREGSCCCEKIWHVLPCGGTAILLRGLEIWVLTALMPVVLEGAYVGFARGVARIWPLQGRYGRWTYPHSENFLRASGLQRFGTYIRRRQNMVVEWIANWPILELCLQSE